MRKVTFIIDDIEYLRNLYKEELTEEQFNEIVINLNTFKAIYTLTGNQMADRYTLTTPEGEKLNINDLSGYQKGCIINDCVGYFESKDKNHKDKLPCGVVKVIEEEI